MNTYVITCLDCQASRKIKIVQTALGARIDWLDDLPHEDIVAGRERLDGEWGWECRCGNDTRLTSQERRHFSNPAAPKPEEIDTIVKNLEAEKVRSFEMAAV